MYGVTMHLKYRREIINQLNSCKKIENCGEKQNYVEIEGLMPAAKNGNENMQFECLNYP